MRYMNALACLSIVVLGCSSESEPDEPAKTGNATGNTRTNLSSSETSVSSSDMTFLDDLPENGRSIHRGRMKLGKRGLTGFKAFQQVRMKGVVQNHSLSTHATPKGVTFVTYRLRRRYGTFTGHVGICEPATEILKDLKKMPTWKGRCASPLIFRVRGEGHVLWESKPVQVVGRWQDFRVSVAGIDELRLEVVSKGPANFGWSAWVQPRLAAQGASATPRFVARARISGQPENVLKNRQTTSRVKPKRPIKTRRKKPDVKSPVRRRPPRILTRLPLPTEEELQIDKKLVAEIRAMVRKKARMRLPAVSRKKAEIPYDEYQRRQFRAQFIESYKKYGRRDKKWDRQALAFLEKTCRYLCYNLEEVKLYPVILNEVKPDVLLREGGELLKLGCDDPQVLSLYASLKRVGSPTELVEAAAIFRRARASFKKTRYPAWTRFLHSNNYCELLKRFRSPRTVLTIGIALEQMVGEYAEAVSQEGLTDLQRARIYADLTWVMRRRVFAETATIADAVKKGKGVDPWLRKMTLSQAHFRAGWNARGGGAIDKVTNEGLRRFKLHLNASRKYAVEAWKLRPNLTESTNRLIQITMAINGLVGETERFWFDRSVRIRFDQIEAYVVYMMSLQRRWGGSNQQLLAFGLECLQTKRFETRVPHHFAYSVLALGYETGNPRLVFSNPVVYRKYVELLTETRRRSKTDRERDGLSTAIVAVNWLSGRHREARKLLEHLGDRANESVLKSYKLSKMKIQSVTR